MSFLASTGPVWIRDPSGTESRNMQLNKINRCSDSWLGRLPLTTNWKMPVLHGPPAKVKVVHLFRCYTHTHAFIQRSFYSQTLLQPLHKEAFTAKIFLQGSSYKQKLFIHRSFYSEKPVNRAALHTEAFIHTQKKEQPLHRAAFTH